MREIRFLLSDKNFELVQGLSTRDLTKAVLEYANSSPVSSNGLVTIDSLPALGRKVLIRTDWKQKYNSQEGKFNGKRQIAAYDILNLEGKALDSSRKDWNDSVMIVDTTYEYIDDKTGRIHQHPDNVIKGVEPWSSKAVIIPVYQRTPLPEVKSTKEGRYLLSATFRESNMKKLTDRLVFVSEKDPADIVFWTRPTEYRTGNVKTGSIKRAVGFGFLDGRFHVGGLFDDGFGRSRGVSVVKSPRSGRKK